MNCTVNDINLSFDKENRLRDTIMRVSKTDSNKAVVLAGFLVNADFKKFLLKNITNDDILQGETISFNLFTNNDYIKINQNKLGSFLVDFYKNTYLSVDNSKTIKGMGRLDGFTSAAAKKIAKTHTASMLIDEYRKELIKDPKSRRKPLEIIADVNRKITNTFYDRVDDFTKYLLGKEDASQRAKEMAQQYIELNNKLNEINKLNQDDNSWIEANQNRKEELENQIKNYIKEANNAKKAKDVATFKNIVANMEAAKKTLAELNEDTKKIVKKQAERINNGVRISRDKYALAHNIVTLFADNYDDKQGVKLRNYANLVTQSRANADSWYFQVFNTKNMTSVVKEFNKVEDIEEYIEAQDENNDNIDDKYNEHNIDETTKSWEDNLYRNFNQTISGKLRMILSTVPKLSNKFNPTSDVQALDTENELGVTTYMDAQYLTVQIYSFGDFSSVDSLIDSLDKRSQTIKSLYGLGQIVNTMRNNKAFANYMYANFAKPIANKTMLVISDIANENGMEFDYSNANSFPLAELVFRMSNKVRATYNSTYNAADITTLSTVFNNFAKDKNKKVFADELFKIVNRYFPNFNKEVFNNYFDNLPESEIKESANKIIRSLQDTIRGIASLKKTINNRTLELDAAYKAKREQYNKDIKKYNDLSPTERKNAIKPVFPIPQYVDYANYDLNKQIYSGIISFVQQIVNYTDSRAQLNSTNAEGNSASSVLKNCYVTRFFEQIAAETEKDPNAGLKVLSDYVIQGTDAQTENQYSNNPLFFGLKDENGVPIKGAEGMFTKTTTGCIINSNAKDIIKYSLFDGTKNTQDSKAANYAAMSKLDFFITQYMAFRDSTAEITEEGKIKNIGSLNSAVYSMRIGSDAPKIFFIRAPRYSSNQVQYAIYGHLMDEFNMFIKGISNLFIQEGTTVVDGKEVPIFKTRTDVNNLIGRAFFDEKTANKLKQNGEVDMTSAIVKDGKLQGNLFNFLRLFKVNGYNADKEIKSMMSLYGEANTGSILSLDEDGRLRLNHNNIIVYNQATSKFELNLNQEQKAQLKQIVRNWTQNFLIEAKSRTTGFVKVLQDNNISFDERTLNDFLLNSVNMNMNYDDLFEGDYKYYNGARDFLKRTKESQAGGDGYAGYNVTDKFDTSIKDLVWNGQAEAIQIQSKQTDKDGNPINEQVVINGRPLVAQNGFKAVTIYNTVKASDYADDLQKELEGIFIEQGMSADNAHKRSVKIASGYGFAGGERTKINDAQSYITLEEFIRRKWADGTIEDYADLIRQLTDDTPAKDINLDEINSRIQVQKNFYFDKIFDKDTGLFYPRQIKNAEFVLIPKLLPEGSELKKVHDWMQANKIGQLNTVETSKAAKKNIFTIWDAKTGDITDSFLSMFDDSGKFKGNNDIYNESYAENYYYQYLYKQQDVPQHMMDEHNKAGVQIMKKIIDNIINEEEADNPKRKQLVQWANEYQNAYTANIREDFHLFLEGMGWEYDTKTGSIVNSEYATTDVNGNKLPDSVIETNRTTLNFNNFYTRAREEAARLSMDSNFMEYLIPNEFGNPIMPNFMNIVTAKLESVAQSIYNNKITRQVLPGWHAAQITGVGYSKRLNFDPKTGIMEVRLPRWSNIIPKTKNTEEEAALIKQIEEEGLDIHIGYRIPTEGKQSISILKVVGFTNDALGSTIIVPDEWVTQTGSDFDVDSVYGISWEMYSIKDKKTNKISLHKIPFEEDTIDERNLYTRYVKNNIDAKIKRTEIGQEIETSLKEIKDKLNFVNERGEFNEEYQDIDAKRNELFNELPDWARGISKDVDIKANRKAKKDRTVVDIRETYPEISNKFITYLESHNISEEEASTVKEYVDYLTALLDVMNRQDGLPAFDKEAYVSEKADTIRTIVEQAKAAQFAKYEKAAKDADLMDFNTWSKQPFVAKLDRRARNNYIIDRMIKIMNDNTSREEQYGRSNFDNITNGKTGANDIIDKISGKSQRPISPYNPLDQLDYFEDAMGGARLKALSVNWDTFISKNNRIRAFISNEDAVQVILTIGEQSAEDSVINYNEEEIRKSYAEDITDYKEIKNNKVNKQKFTIVPLHDIDKKANIKASMSNKYIGFANGINGSSTANYAQQAKNQNIPVNSNDYNSNDVIFVSVPGKRGDANVRKQQQDLTIKEAIKALNAGATILTDTKNYTDNSNYNEGEKRLKANLEYLGIKYVEINGIGVWNKNGDFSKINNKNKVDVNKTIDSINTTNNQKKILFTARRLGWSKNNRNIVGNLITTYASQTTAHHLDAVKMGSVPNVDEFTFSIYKYLSAIGIDYENVIGFIRQPIITQLVANNNLIKSVFISNNNQAIKMTLADIVNKLGIKNGKYDITYNTSNNKIINAIKTNGSFVQAFNTLFGIDISQMDNSDILNIKLPLDKQRMFTRIKRDAQQKGNVIENAAFDFGMLLTFKNIQRSAEKINKYISATNADKFGAKASIHETRNTIEEINKLRDDYTLSKDGIPFIELIYPSTDEYHSRIDVENSQYKSIAAVYAYATNPSLQTNTKLFTTENDDFNITEHIIQNTIHHRFTEAEYKEYKKYAISYLYNEIEKLLTPLTVDKKGKIMPNTEMINQSNSELKTANDYWNAERSRICGYGVTLDGDFDIKNVNKPTKNDITQFNKLTPAQKVLFIQKHFPDNQGIFNYVKVTLLNNTDVKYKGISRQYLSFDDQVDDIEDLLYLFTNSFSNHNPLIKLAAIDLIKYAFIAEGYNYKSGYVSKTVPNETLYKSIDEGGLDIIDEIKSRVQQLPYIMRSEEFIDQFVRSHSDIIPIKRLYPLPKKKPDLYTGEMIYSTHNESTQFLASMRGDKLVHIDATTNNSLVESLISSLNLFNLVKGYTKIAFPIDENHSSTVLYKVEGRNEVVDEKGNIIAYKDYFLVPLNLLDKYETYEHSYNKNYNIFNSKEYYDYTIEELTQKMASARDELFNITDDKQFNTINAGIRSKVNRNVPSVVMPVGAYKNIEINLGEDKDGLMKLYDGGDDFTKGGVQKLIDGITTHVRDAGNDFSTPYVQFNPNLSVKRLIPIGTAVTQNIVMADGSTMNVTIAHHKITDKFGREIEQMKLGRADAGVYAEAIKELNNTQTLIKNADIYRVTRTKENPKTLKDNALKAATDLIVDADESVITSLSQPARRGKIDILSSSIINEISYDARKNNTPIANSFIHELDRLRVNRRMGSSIIENRGNIYRSAARYYRSAANTILNKLDAFQMLDKDGNPATYSMDDPAMYEALAANDEYFREVADIILRGITFGNRIADIFKLDISAEDVETKNAVQEIINNINSVRQNKKLADAMNNIINIYFKKYSTNPEIVRGMLDLRESFGDLDKIDALIADPTDIDNNETQVILKQVYSMFAKAEMFDTQRNVQEWKDRLAEIEAMSGLIDIDKVIDSERGMIRQDYNSQFLEDKQKVIDNLNIAYNNRNNSLADFEKYIRAKYARDKFMSDNTEQHIIGEYYEQDLALRKEVMDNAGSVYFKYMQLSQELYDTNTGIDDDNEANANRKRKIISAMQQLRSEVDVTGAEKSIEEAKKARALDKFIKARRELVEKYFDSQEYDGFQEDYIRYKNYVDKYDAAHKYDSLEKKFAEDAQYREAYNWIKNNGRVAFGKEESIKLRQHFKNLIGRANVIRNKTIAKLKNIEGVVDESGMINPMKLTDEQIAQIRDEEMSDLAKMYDNSYTEAILIKDVPKNVPLLHSKPKKKNNDEDIYAELKYQDNATKVATITEINKILGKCVDKYTGSIDIATLFNNNVVSDEERIKLATLYNRLRNLRTEKMRRYKKRKNKVYEDAINDTAFLTAMNYYRTNLQNTKQGKQFLDIFTELDFKGNVVANSYIYGYKIPNTEYVDNEKTEALEYINKNVDFVTNEYYDIAMRQAQEQGEEAYNKWFRLNHVYNPYSHKYEPLKIWTKLEAKPNSELTKSMQYIPSFDNIERSVKKEYINNVENRKRLGLKGEGYKEFSNNYKKGNPKYDSNITLNDKEKALRDLYTNTLNKYATTYQGKRFVGQGYLPRERKNEIDTKWAIGQLGALLGISWHSGADSNSFHKEVDYSHDREAEMKMLTLLENKGTKKYKSLPIKGTMSDEDYAKEVAKVREENRKIKAENERIDNAILNKNWNEVMEDFIHNATIFNSRQAAKPYLYLLLEDLAINNAYMIKGVWGKKLIKDTSSSTDDDTTYMTVPQTRTREIVHNLARRLLYDQYHENNTYRSVANFLQNLTSAKYMVFNLYGGIANITTGKVNIAMEEYANEYFGFKEFASAEKQYLANTPSMIASIYSDKAPNLTTAFIKEFNVVEFDQILQFGAGSENLDEQLKRVRDWMYSFQSLGEHYMQNSVLLAMLKSNRLYTDGNGIQRIGDFKDFTWDIERQAMEEVLKDNEILLTNYRTYVEGMKDAIDLKYEISTNKKDLNRNYLYSLRDDIRPEVQSLYNKTADAYHKKREELMKEAKEKFRNNPTVESLYEFKDGKAVLTTKAIADFNAKGKNTIGDLEHLLGSFKKKVESVNKKIHGVYDKNGAAQIESKWWGSLIMQYHKHLYNGIFKRWRKKGFYSEFRGSRERGSYITLMDFLGTEFTNFKKRIGNKQENGTNIALASIQVAMESAINSLTNIAFNWNNLSNFEKANIKRNLGDVSGVLAAVLIVMALYGLYDDDDIKDDTFKASLLYLADRLYSDSSMFSPVGLVTEYKTAWSSPIASANGPSDLIKAMMMIPQALFDPDFNPKYQSGQYAGKNKFEVLFRRNLPGVRPWDRIQLITKNNKYYKVGESQIGVNIAKNFGEALHE